jgi:hypothetical protein
VTARGQPIDERMPVAGIAAGTRNEDEIRHGTMVHPRRCQCFMITS